MDKYKTLFSSISIGRDAQPALHVRWSMLDYCAVKLISGILGREITAETRREEFYYWSIDIKDAPITDDEIVLLNSVLNTNGDDYGIQKDSDYPLEEFRQEDACKLFSLLAPFKVVTSFADDNGVWFIGKAAELPF